jgi:L-tyrosine isonitrile synthase
MEKCTVESAMCELEDYSPFPVSRSDYSQSAEIAKTILAEVMQYRRFSGPEKKCGTSACQTCVDLHLSKIISAVELGLPVTLVLPAFPGKSPNLTKVFGPLPDMAERRALEFLQQLCDQIKQYYSPGAQIILCSDGRVFSDVVGMRDEDVNAYQSELSKMIAELKLVSISAFSLDELYNDISFAEMRALLMKNYGESLEILQKAVSRGKDKDGSIDDKEAHRLYCGITRFLLEDATFPGQQKSRTALQKECRSRAYEVIQRSKAWGQLVAVQFPDAVRLSIHPQSCGSTKLGIRLIEPDNWVTPWHGVAVDVGGHFVLFKRSQAEELGATLIHREGRPSHYVLTDKKELLKFQGAPI